MKIGFDAKRIFNNITGLGNYSRYIIKILSTYFPENEYILFTPKNKLKYSFEQITVQPKIPFLWREIFINFNKIYKKLDIYHGLSNEIPLNIDKKVKKIITVHDLIFLLFPNYYKLIDREIYKFKLRNSLNNADKIITISNTTKNDLLNFFKIDEQRIVTIYQSCNEIFKKKYDKNQINEVLNKYKLPNQFILFVGRIEPRKNLELIIKSIRDIDISLIVIGKKTDYYKKINDLIKFFNIEKKVLFFDNIYDNEELAKIYQASSLCVYPSLYEGFGIPIIEAIYSNVPIIVSDINIFKEVTDNSLLTCNPYDPDDLNSKIKYVLNNTNDYFSKYSKIYEKLKEKYDDQKIANQYINTYSEAVSA